MFIFVKNRQWFDQNGLFVTEIKPFRYEWLMADEKGEKQFKEKIQRSFFLA